MNQLVFTEEDYNENSLFIQMELNELYINHTIRVYKQFDGDVILAIILGAIAHHTIANIAKICNYDGEKVIEYMKSDDSNLLLLTNAHSISEYTGIPRETVRRKIEILKKKGWVGQDERAAIFLDPSIHNVFRDISYNYARNFIEVANVVMKKINVSKCEYDI
ncbi:hypothetical protein [Desulfomicrobium salsuginis]